MLNLKPDLPIVSHNNSQTKMVVKSDALISTRNAHTAGRDSAPGHKSKTPQLSRIHRSTYVVWLVLFYAFLVLFSWIVFCKLTYKPITANHYGYQRKDPHYYHADYTQSFYHRNMRWYETAQVIQTIATVLTIPLTSAVCSHAVVVYLQHCTGEQTPNVTLRQMLVLTDKGWTSIVTFFHLVTGKWRRYSSPFLVWAILLHFIGAIISPLLQVFISTETVKTPTYPLSIQNLPDMISKLNTTEYHHTDSTVGTTRKLLASTSPNDSPSLLWSGSNNCTTLGGITVNETFLCSKGGNSWSNIFLLPEPFLSLLPTDFNTGLIQQFLPRFNSTATYKRITAEEFPRICDPTQGALSISKSQSLDTSAINGSSDRLAWELHACMPADLRKSPWKVSRARQDFTEGLYLNVSLSKTLMDEIGILDHTAEPFSTYIHITVDTTAGYFELPNYMNAQKAGPILNDGPNSACGESCTVQSTIPEG